MNDPLLVAARRMWNAAYELDRIRDDSAATDWVAGKVCRMIEGKLPDDLATVERLTGALEAQLERLGTS
jgi:hypothetical protein